MQFRHERPAPPKVALPQTEPIPFSRIFTLYRFDARQLAEWADVRPAIIGAMCADEPVLEEHARRVLAAVSGNAGRACTLRNVRVNVIAQKQGSEG